MKRILRDFDSGVKPKLTKKALKQIINDSKLDSDLSYERLSKHHYSTDVANIECNRIQCNCRVVDFCKYLMKNFDIEEE